MGAPRPVTSMRVANDNFHPCSSCGASNWVTEPDGLGIERRTCAACGDQSSDDPWVLVFLATAALTAILSVVWALG